MVTEMGKGSRLRGRQWLSDLSGFILVLLGPESKHNRTQELYLGGDDRILIDWLSSVEQARVSELKMEPIVQSYTQRKLGADWERGRETECAKGLCRSL